MDHELKNRILNTDENFIFTYRGGEPRDMINYIMQIGIPVKIPNKEKSKFKFKYPTNDVKNQREFMGFANGERKSLTKKDIHQSRTSFMMSKRMSPF